MPPFFFVDGCRLWDRAALEQVLCDQVRLCEAARPARFGYRLLPGTASGAAWCVSSEIWLPEGDEPS